MKAQFLKIAGVKTDKEFYNKYPTEEEFFAKCGAKIKKAFPGMTIPGMEGMTAMQGAQGAFSGANPLAQNIFQNGTFQQINPGPSSPATAGGLMQGGVGQALQSLGGANPVQKVFDTIQGFRAQKERVAGAKQNMQVMGHLEDAKASNDLYEQQNLQDARMKTYVGGDRDEFGMTGEELFPMYGVGTNVLKKGGTVKAQNGFMSGFGQQALGTGVNMGMQQLNIGGNDMGSQIGGDILGAAGAMTGVPGLDMLGKVIGTGIGDLLDKSDTKIERYNQQAENSINNMIGMNMGRSVRSRFGGNLKNGGTMKYADGGDIQMLGDGSLTPLSSNPYGGDMHMINGDSHSKGGEDMVVNGQKLEAEGQEPIFETSEGDKVIAGNLKPAKHIKKAVESFTGEKLSGSKYKHITKSLGKIEDKTTKMVENNVSKADQYTPLRPLDRISLNTLDLNVSAADKKLQKLQVAKETLASAQEAQNEMEQTAKNGKKIYAQKGVTTTTDNTTLPPNTFRTEQEAFDAGFYKTQDGKLEKIDEVGQDAESFTVDGQSTTTSKTKPGSAGRVTKSADKLMSDKDWKAYLAKETPEQKAARYAREQKQGLRTGYVPSSTEEITVPGNPTVIETPGTPTTYEYANILPLEETDVENTNVPEWWQGLNIMNSDAEPFNNAQLLPEAWTMANNKLEPVQAQQFNPRLRVPYDISLQDQLNQNTAKARGAERMAAYNPGMLANLKAQEYMADQNVLGNEFRQNQGFKDQVYSGNLNTLNDAQLKNLAIADTQYVRQQQALTNTNDRDFAAIDSMTNKRMQHNLENQTLRVMENMYDFRYDPAGRAQYRGEGWNPKDGWASTGSAGGNTNWPPQGYEFVYDQSGRPIDVRKSKNASDQAWQTPGIVSRNGSIVKSYKKFK
jgi:hypothetical protein